MCEPFCCVVVVVVFVQLHPAMSAIPKMTHQRMTKVKQPAVLLILGGCGLGVCGAGVGVIASLMAFPFRRLFCRAGKKRRAASTPSQRVATPRRRMHTATRPLGRERGKGVLLEMLQFLAALTAPLNCSVSGMEYFIIEFVNDF